MYELVHADDVGCSPGDSGDVYVKVLLTNCYSSVEDNAVESVYPFIFSVCLFMCKCKITEMLDRADLDEVFV